MLLLDLSSTSVHLRYKPLFARGNISVINVNNQDGDHLCVDVCDKAIHFQHSHIITPYLAVLFYIGSSFNTDAMLNVYMNYYYVTASWYNLFIQV